MSKQQNYKQFSTLNSFQADLKLFDQFKYPTTQTSKYQNPSQLAQQGRNALGSQQFRDRDINSSYDDQSEYLDDIPDFINENTLQRYQSTKIPKHYMNNNSRSASQGGSPSKRGINQSSIQQQQQSKLNNTKLFKTLDVREQIKEFYQNKNLEEIQKQEASTFLPFIKNKAKTSTNQSLNSQLNPIKRSSLNNQTKDNFQQLSESKFSSANQNSFYSMTYNRFAPQMKERKSLTFIIDFVNKIDVHFQKLKIGYRIVHESQLEEFFGETNLKKTQFYDIKAKDKIPIQVKQIYPQFNEIIPRMPNGTNYEEEITKNTKYSSIFQQKRALATKNTAFKNMVKQSFQNQTQQGHNRSNTEESQIGEQQQKEQVYIYIELDLYHGPYLAQSEQYSQTFLENSTMNPFSYVKQNKQQQQISDVPPRKYITLINIFDKNGLFHEGKFQLRTYDPAKFDPIDIVQRPIPYNKQEVMPCIMVKLTKQNKPSLDTLNFFSIPEYKEPFLHDYEKRVEYLRQKNKEIAQKQQEQREQEKLKFGSDYHDNNKFFSERVYKNVLTDIKQNLVQVQSGDKYFAGNTQVNRQKYFQHLNKNKIDPSELKNQQEQNNNQNNNYNNYQQQQIDKQEESKKIYQDYLNKVKQEYKWDLTSRTQSQAGNDNKPFQSSGMSPIETQKKLQKQEEANIQTSPPLKNFYQYPANNENNIKNQEQKIKEIQNKLQEKYSNPNINEAKDTDETKLEDYFGDMQFSQNQKIKTKKRKLLLKQMNEKSKDSIDFMTPSNSIAIKNSIVDPSNNIDIVRTPPSHPFQEFDYNQQLQLKPQKSQL